jgi:hypothetical protein
MLGGGLSSIVFYEARPREMWAVAILNQTDDTPTADLKLMAGCSTAEKTMLWNLAPPRNWWDGDPLRPDTSTLIKVRFVDPLYTGIYWIGSMVGAGSVYHRSPDRSIMMPYSSN